MKELLLTALGLTLLAAVQAGLGSVWRPLGVKPDLVLLGVVMVGLLAGPRRALWAALIGGLSLDVLSVLPIGTHMLALSLAAPVVALSARFDDPTSIVVPLVLTPVATLLYNGAQMLELALLGRLLVGRLWIGQTVLPLMIMNALLVPAFWLPFGLIRRNRSRFA